MVNRKSQGSVGRSLVARAAGGKSEQGRARWWLTATGATPGTVPQKTHGRWPLGAQAKVKWCGKSAPRRRRRRRQGKPHRLQDQAAGRRKPHLARVRAVTAARPAGRLLPHASGGGRTSRQRLVQINDRRPPQDGNRTRLTDRALGFTIYYLRLAIGGCGRLSSCPGPLGGVVALPADRHRFFSCARACRRTRRRAALLVGRGSSSARPAAWWPAPGSGPPAEPLGLP